MSIHIILPKANVNMFPKVLFQIMYLFFLLLKETRYLTEIKAVNIVPREPTRENRTSIARQRRGKDVSSTIQAVFSAWSVQSIYKKCSAV
jgi:hypothetical protein